MRMAWLARLTRRPRPPAGSIVGRQTRIRRHVLTRYCTLSDGVAFDGAVLLEFRA